MTTWKEALAFGISLLLDKKVKRPKDSVEEILAFVVETHRMDLLLYPDRLLLPSQLERFCQLLQKRATHLPLEYVLGEISFYGLSLEVGPQALLPRVETEILVDLVCKKWKKRSLKGRVLWDLGCGSGAIGLAIKKCFAELSVVLSDISLPALELAQKNAKKNQLSVSFLQGDWLEPFSGKGKADFIIGNPPYISEEEYDTLDRELKEFEPKQALVGGKTGYEVYERLAQELPDYLHPSAQIWFEIGYRQKKKLKEIFSHPRWLKKECFTDWSGKDRFFFLEIE